MNAYHVSSKYHGPLHLIYSLPLELWMVKSFAENKWRHHQVTEPTPELRFAWLQKALGIIITCNLSPGNLQTVWHCNNLLRIRRGCSQVVTYVSASKTPSFGGLPSPVKALPCQLWSTSLIARRLTVASVVVKVPSLLFLKHDFLQSSGLFPVHNPFPFIPPHTHTHNIYFFIHVFIHSHASICECLPCAFVHSSSAPLF